MKIVLQRVKSASVTVDNQVVGEIGQGYLLLLGVGNDDSEQQAEKLVDKITKLRIFPDENDKINLSIQDVGGEVLVVSQFTLYADCRKGTRPNFIDAGNPADAERLYEYVLKLCSQRFKKTAHGIFGAKMDVSLINDGPFTLVLQSD